MEGHKTKQCWECRRRRLVCDFTRPGCRKCQVRGVACPGYEGRKLKWLEPQQVNAKGPLKWVVPRPLEPEGNREMGAIFEAIEYCKHTFPSLPTYLGSALIFTRPRQRAHFSRSGRNRCRWTPESLLYAPFRRSLPAPLVHPESDMHSAVPSCPAAGRCICISASSISPTAPTASRRGSPGFGG